MSINRIASIVIVLVGVIFIMVTAKDFLIPIVIAGCLWYITASIAKLIGKIKIGSFSIPPLVCTILASLSLIVAFVISVEIIVQSVDNMLESAPDYQERFDSVRTNFLALFNIKKLPSFAQVLDQLDLKSVVANFGISVTSFAGSTFLVIIYAIFLILEQSTFSEKWKSSFESHDEVDHANQTLARINQSVGEYLSVKTGISLATALLSYAVMVLVGLDFAVFWAFLIFILNFIPNIGSLLATSMPVLLALLQFDSLTPAIIVFVALVTIQIVISSFIEPKLMGSALNISGLVVLISLSFWGAIWGIAGMLLSVPLTVTVMIVLSEFPETRVVAVWLSEKGKVEKVGQSED